MTEAQPERPEERWVYVGVRLGKSNAKVHAWIDTTGEEMWFAKLKGAIIGGIYTVKVERGPDGKFQSVLLGVDWTSERETDTAKLAEWHAANRLTEAVLTKQRNEAKAKQHDEFDDAIAPLRDLFQRTARTSTQRSAFVAMVIDHLYRR